MKGACLLILCCLTVSCQKEALDDNVRLAVEENLMVLDKDAPPAILAQILETNEIVITGETHYVQEHQDFVVSLLPQLGAAGYRVIFDELFHCFSWMVEDYINGDIDTLPEFILYFNETLIEGIKTYNNQVNTEERFRLAYMDVNHWQSNFSTSITAIEVILGHQPIFSSIRDLEVDSEAYQSALRDIYQALETESHQFIASWGQRWYTRILNIVSVEIKSSDFRVHRVDQDREAAMLENIRSVIQGSPGIKVLINTGMSHAQKVTYMGNQIPRLGQFLGQENDRTYTMAFIGMKGQLKRRFNDTQNMSIDLIQNASGDNLTKLVGDLAHGNMSFLPLSDAAFISRNVKVSYDFATTISAPVGNQFDAIVTYPQISTLRSMDKYDYQ